MSILDNPALIAECSETAVSIHSEVVGHLRAGSPLPYSDSSQPEKQQLQIESDAERGLRPVGKDILWVVEGLAFEVLGLRASAGGCLIGDDYTSTSTLRTPRPPPSSGPEADEEEKSSEPVIARLDAEIERTYRRFYDYVYADLPFCWRLLYTELSLLKFSAVVFLYNARRAGRDREGGGRKRGGKMEGGDEEKKDEDEDEGKVLDELVAVLDQALILAGGAGLKRGRRAISRLLGYLDDAPPTSLSSLGSPFPAKFPSSRPFTPPVERPIRVVDRMSMSAFQAYLDGRNHPEKADEDLDLAPEPLVLTSLMNEWPALSTRPWSSPAYLMSRTHGGRRLVPVEVGRSYVDEGWTQELIPFRELVARVVTSASPSTTSTTTISTHTTIGTGPEPGPEKGTTYLAQHELFAQLPHLLNDILTPDHCFTSPPAHPFDKTANKPELDVPLVNAWFGPPGTITPLHTDGYHNLLCQVVGEKYVRLYAPRDSEALCPRGFDDDYDAVENDDGREEGEGDEDLDGKRKGGQGVKKVDMSNTSAFDVGAVEGWDPDTEGRDPMELEEFRGLRYWDCVLGPGEVLYIPIGWWHYVRSLSVSFSVSFWWNGDHYVGPEDEESR